MSSIRALLGLGATALLCSTRAEAQGRLFPAVRSFELPEASPRAYGMVARVLSLRRGDSRFGAEQEGEVILGENFPLVALNRGPRPIILGLGSQAYGRFSLEDSKSALISLDFVAQLNTTALVGPWALTLQLNHESSHLGDEYANHFGVVRLDWSREVLTGWASYRSGDWRFTGGGSYVLYDGLSLPRPAVAFGIDFRGHRTGARMRAVEPVIGIYTEATAATNWRLSQSAKVGLTLTGQTGPRLGVALIAHDGLSTQRQFYRKESRYIGLELRIDP
ncbi:MAG TPA: DUF1207 domain-containing protein [Gemmatimonadales bacterium]|nr:DUF1207 domain-containing protein [Gemmatimonadales bacterium]